MILLPLGNGAQIVTSINHKRPMHWPGRLAGVAVLVALAYGVVRVRETAREIRQQSEVDEVHPADIIMVLGAAEYRGKPSPVLEARLNHALVLYLKGLAPRIMTTGGAGGDPQFTEGEVGRTYLSQHGVPSEAIVVEAEGASTVESTVAGAEIMQRLNVKSCIVVSDGYHIYRVKKILEARGVAVYGSPRPDSPKTVAEKSNDDWRQQWIYYRQAIAYMLWRMGVAI